MGRRTRNRKDHILPQGYLRGFVDPSRDKLPKPLWYYDVQHRKWSNQSTKEIGWQRGFYDYENAGLEVPLADNAFTELERKFSLVRTELVASNFSDWRDHRDFLLRYMQMLRARSELFFHQKITQQKNEPVWKVLEVGEDGRSLKVEPTTVPDAFQKNRALTEMQNEIKKGADWLNEFDWALRWTDNLDDSFMTTDSPLAMEGTEPNMTKAMQAPDTFLHFPLCWQAWLFGSRRPFNVKTDRVVSQHSKKLREVQKQNAKTYIVSPVQWNEL